MSFYARKRQDLFIYFEECVKKHFGFLIDMSYSIEKGTMGWNAIYTSDKVELYIYYERISFEIYSTISLKGGVRYSIDEIIPLGLKRKYLSATDETMVENAIIELKTLITCYGNPFLGGDANVFESVLKARDKNVEDYDLKLIEERAVKAWEKCNYVEVVAIYQSVKENLTPLQEKRLYLALKRINKEETNAL